MPERGTICSFRLKNFKSYRDATLKFSPLTVMIGANASGKSNLIEGLRLVSRMASGREVGDVLRAAKADELVLRGNMTDLPYDGENSFGFGCALEDHGLEGWTEFDIEFSTLDVGLAVVSESIRQPSGAVPLYKIAERASQYSHDIKVEYNNFKGGGGKPRIKCTDQQLVLTQLKTPARFGKTHVKSQELIPKVTETVGEALTQIVFLDPVPSMMRDYSHIVERTLGPKGRFLSSVLYDVCKVKAQEGRVLDFVRQLPEQDIKSIEFIRTERDDVMVQAVETFAGREHKRDAPVLSDGTLRVLAIAAALLSAPEGALVVIEEIDNGVHPSRAGILLDNIFNVSRDRRLSVLLTTHNPALLDALPADAVPKVACCYRDAEEGHSKLVHLEDLPSYPELVAQGLLGRLMTKNIIDRFLKDTRSDGQKADKALAWLRSMEESVP